MSAISGTTNTISATQAPLLRVAGLIKHFPVRRGVLLRKVGDVHAVDNVSFEINAGETLGLVGESGCGKSTLGRAVLWLDPPNSGDVYFEGRSLRQMSSRQRRALRSQMQIVFQDPFESLNSRMTVGRIVEEPLIIHRIGDRAHRQQQVKTLLDRVGLPRDAAEKYPHEFSGGQRQRIGIARAIALRPKLLVCDEAVSALDVSVQAQILNLLLELQAELGLAMLFIAHDLSVVKHVSDQIAVMYLGKIVEIAPSHELYRSPKHPYTRALISAIPDAEFRTQGLVRPPRILLAGDVPSPIDPPPGCRFQGRCMFANEQCRREIPVLEVCAPQSAAACWRWRELTPH